MDNSEVKGLWFASTRAYLHGEGGDELLEKLAMQMHRHADALRDPTVGEWYPEAALHELLESLWHWTGRDPDAYVNHTAGATHQGIGKFFKILIALGSPNFVLRKIPVMWGRLRRGDLAQIEVVPGPIETLVTYRRFPWFRHEVYQLMTVGSLRGVVEMSTGRTPQVEIVSSGLEHVGVLVRHGDAARRPR